MGLLSGVVLVVSVWCGYLRCYFAGWGFVYLLVCLLGLRALAICLLSDFGFALTWDYWFDCLLCLFCFEFLRVAYFVWWFGQRLGVCYLFL